MVAAHSSVVACHGFEPTFLWPSMARKAFQKKLMMNGSWNARSAKALMDMKTSFTLSDAGEGTSMAWEADVKIAGPVGAMGQRVLQPIINQQVGNVLTALEKQVSEAAAASTGGAEQGIHPASPEAYDADPAGPTHSTDESS